MNENYPHSIELLLNSCIEGDRKSQRILYNIFAPKMFPICLKYAKNQLDAEDILQEGFLKAFNNLHKFRSEGSFEGWMKRIFINAAIESLRKKMSYVPIVEGFDNLLPAKEASAYEKLCAEDLVKTCNELSFGYRTVFNLYVVHGYSHKEIGELLGISESTSKSQFSRARALLRSMIEN